jgi:hypothetical protein
MHFSRTLALVAGLTPAWAVPADPVLDKSPAIIPLDKFKLGGDLKILRPKIPRIPGNVDFGLKKRITLNWIDGEAPSLYPVTSTDSLT